MAASTKKVTKKTRVTKPRARSGSGGGKNGARFSWKRAAPFIAVIALLGGYLGFKILASPTEWTPKHSAVKASPQVKPVIKEEGLTYWFFDVPTLPPLASGAKETLPAYSEIGNLVLTDSAQGAGVYCADVSSYTAQGRVKFTGANVQLPAEVASVGYFAVPVNYHKAICVTADLSAGPLKVIVERENRRNKPKTHILIRKLFKKSAATTPVVQSPETVTARPTATNTGPRVASPKNVGRVEVRGPMELTDVVASEIFVYEGGSLTATNVRVQNTIVVLPKVNAAKSKLHLINSAVHGGITVNVVDNVGNLYWGSEVPVDLLVRGSWIYYRQGNFANGDHTEAVAGFGWPQGARFERSSFVQQGPNNSTATATMNWHGTDTVFDNIWFDWDGPAAAYFTVYVEGRNNVVKNSFLAPTGGYVYPSSSPHATYINNRDLVSGAALKLP